MSKRILIISWFLLAVCAVAGSVPRVDLAEKDFAAWSGMDGGRIESGETAAFRYPEGRIGMFKKGFRVMHDGTRDWRAYAGLEIEVVSEGDREVEVELTVLAPKGLGADERTSGKVKFRSSRRLYLSWDVLGFPQARTSWKKFVLGADVTVRYTDGKGGDVDLKSVHLVKAPAVSLECGLSGKAEIAGGVVQYDVVVGNSSAEEQTIILDFLDPGWRSMEPSISPATLRLKPGESQVCNVRVSVAGKLPAGAYEKQVLQAVGNGDASRASRLEFITGVRVQSPYLLHTADRWQDVRDKVENFPWARERQQEVIGRADNWEVPEVEKAPCNDPDDTWGPFLFQKWCRYDLMASGIAWQLMGEDQYAEKAAVFLRRLSDPETGYPKTLRATIPNQVQEGQFFQDVAMVYDMVKDAGVLSEADCRQIDATLRLFMESMARLADSGSINNWNVAEAVGAFYCALAMQDLSAAERWFKGPSGICEQLRIGTMDDGWWYECSVGYNTWVASQFSQVALAYQPWGVDFKNMTLPASFAENVLLQPELNGGQLPDTLDPMQLAKPFGMDPSVYGPLRKPSRKIKDLWDSMNPFIDWRGVMFGVNDSTEHSVVAKPAGLDPSPFELAYFLYRDPAYASVIKRGTTRDLLYGVPILPDDTPEYFRDSAVADNAGLAMLRSHSREQPIREQIQAVLHYGTHGWAHGHFDRTGLLSLMRYGRSFYNPESIWHGYEKFLYKFYVQTSVAKNMVVVDRKMQEATPGRRLLFHSGEMMQAVAVETTARWSHPPYGGMVYDYVPVKSFKEKTERENRDVPIPADAPGYGEITGYTEPVRQLRLMLVMDDYVLLADYLKGNRPHEFESLFQMKGFLGIEAPEKKYLRHDAQWDTDPRSGAQFVTDCDWYAVTAPAVSRFEMKFGPDADNAGTRVEFCEDGDLKLDVHTLWPPRQEIMFAAVPENHRTGQQVFYDIRGDGELLAEGDLRTWTLGKSEIDVEVRGVKTLELETRVTEKRHPSIFWGNARIVTSDGREIPFSDIGPEFVNIRKIKEVNKDYREGPVKIDGEVYEFSTPAQPDDHESPGVVTLDLSKVDAVRFKVNIGCDFLQGDESQRRKTMAVKAAEGTDARFLTLIEPYEEESVVKSATADSDSKILVELIDGRLQEITIHDLTGEPTVEVIERRGSKELRREKASSYRADRRPR